MHGGAQLAIFALHDPGVDERWEGEEGSVVQMASEYLNRVGHPRFVG